MNNIYKIGSIVYIKEQKKYAIVVGISENSYTLEKLGKNDLEYTSWYKNEDLKYIGNCFESLQNANVE